MKYHKDFKAEENLEHAGVHYINFMTMLNRELAPRSYFEIGTQSGSSLNTMTCDAVCVDPGFLLNGHEWLGKRKRTLLFQSTSDDFFANEDLHDYFPSGPDIMFLDGMHRAEYLLRDFMNAERYAHPRSLILLHDCLPMNRRMAEREIRRGEEPEGPYRDYWTGDVWRVLFALRARRPELRVHLLNCPPTGLVLVSGLNASSTVFDESYDAVVDYMMGLELDEPTMRELWSIYPCLDSAVLAANPGDISAIFNCR